MATPKLELTYIYMTAPRVRGRLDLSRYQLDERIRRDIFPTPTFVDSSGVRFFDENWVRTAKAILENSPNHSGGSKKGGADEISPSSG